jgi:hypothetical protein
MREVYAHEHEFVLCTRCMRAMKPAITLRTIQPPTDALWPMWHPNLGHEPVEVRSWGHFKQLLKERNLSNVLAS